MSITYGQLQQAVARRTGPFFQAAQDSQTPTTSTTIAAYMPTLKSSSLLGGPENLFLVRRTATVPVTDRVRGVLSFDSSAARVVVDNNWSVPMQAGELADFVHLHPEQELKPAVLAGLDRCFVPDLLYVQPTSGYGGIDLTSQFPWLQNEWQIQRVRYGWLAPYSEAPWDTYNQAGHLYLTGTYGTYLPSAVWVDAWRPATSWVNGAESTTGPVADSDQLHDLLELAYAAAAGHIEAWHLFPSRMQAAAAGGYQATQAMAAQEFTRQASFNGPQPSMSYGFQTVVHSGVGYRGGSINGPW